MTVQERCPYQKGMAVVICEASQLMTPSLEEMRKYCEQDFRDCPYYRMAAGRRDAPRADCRPRQEFVQS